MDHSPDPDHTPSMSVPPTSSNPLGSVDHATIEALRVATQANPTSATNVTHVQQLDTSNDALNPLSAHSSVPQITDVPSKAPRAIARPLMAILTCGTLIGALGLLLQRVGDAKSKTIAPVSAAANTQTAITPASPPLDTVVAPLNQVGFTPDPPEAPAELSAYAAELADAIRPVINVAYTQLVDNPAPWSSHLYGPSDLPADLAAPLDASGKALCMVAQINLADLPKFPKADGLASTLVNLPAAGLLQFWLSLDAPGTANGWTGGPTFAETAANPRQRVTYVAAADVAQAPVTRAPMSDTCSSRPPAQGPAVAIGLSFSNSWNVPETTDNRFDSGLPTLAGALRAPPPASEFYRATGAINSWLGETPPAQIGGFNRLVQQDPRTVGAVFTEDETRDGAVTDAYEVLFEMHPEQQENTKWNIQFSNQGTGGWWANPGDMQKLADADGPTKGKSGVVPSAFWWDGQAT